MTLENIANRRESKIPGLQKGSKSSEVQKKKSGSNKVNDISINLSRSRRDVEGTDQATVQGLLNSYHEPCKLSQSEHRKATSSIPVNGSSFRGKQNGVKVATNVTTSSSRVKLIPDLFSFASNRHVKKQPSKTVESKLFKSERISSSSNLSSDEARKGYSSKNKTSKVTNSGPIKCSKRIPTLPALSKLTRNKLTIEVLKRSNNESDQTSDQKSRSNECVARVSPIKRPSIKETVNKLSNYECIKDDLDTELSFSPSAISNSLIDKNPALNLWIETAENVGHIGYSTISSPRFVQIKESLRRNSTGTLTERSSFSDSECSHKPRPVMSLISEATAKRLLISPVKQRYNHINRASSSSLSPLMESPPQSMIAASNSRPESLANNLTTSDASSLYSNYANSNFLITRGREQLEILRLRHELSMAREKIGNLNNQLVENVQMMAAFEISLQKMQHKLTQVNATAEEKENQISGLVALIERLKKEENDENEEEKLHVEGLTYSSWFKSQVSRMLRRSKSKKMDYSPLKDDEVALEPNGQLEWTEEQEEQEELVNIVQNCETSRTDRVSMSAPSTPRFMLKNRLSTYDYADDVEVLRKRLLEKEKLLTDLKLELLSTENQVEDLRENTNKLSKQLMIMRDENKRLQTIMDNDPSSASSSSSVNDLKDPFGDYSKRILLILDGWKICSFSILTTTTWSQLDAMVKSKFAEYAARIDQDRPLGLSGEDISSYEVGREKIRRILAKSKLVNGSDQSEAPYTPEMLPYGYLVEENSVSLYLQSLLDSLVFEVGIPKSTVNQIITTIRESKRVVISSQHGSGKSYFARKVGQFLAQYIKMTQAEGTWQVDSALDQGLIVLTMQPEFDEDLRKCFESLIKMKNSQHFPLVLVIENIHHIQDTDQAFSPLDQQSILEMPTIIATGVDNGSNLKYLSLRQNFKSIDWTQILGNDVRFIIRRFLRRKMLAEQATATNGKAKAEWHEISKIIDWVSDVWQNLNLHIDSQNRPFEAMSIEPFLSCPMDISQSKVWFMNLWNIIILPFLRKNLRQDSVEMILAFVRSVHQTYPWSNGKNCLLSVLDDSRDVTTEEEHLRICI